MEDVRKGNYQLGLAAAALVILFLVIGSCDQMRPTHAQEGPPTTNAVPVAPSKTTTVGLQVPEPQAQEILKAASESQQYENLAKVAQETAQAAKTIADGYTQKALAAKLNYERLYFKLRSDLKVQEGMELERKGDSLVFTMKKDGKKDETSKTAPTNNSP